MPLDAALEPFKEAQELQSEPSAQGVLVSPEPLAQGVLVSQDPQDQEVTGLGLLGLLELSLLFPPCCQGTGLAQAQGVLSLSPIAIPALRAWQTPSSPPAQSKFQLPPRGCFSHQVFSKFPLGRSLCPSMRARPALLALLAVTGHNCPLGELQGICSHPSLSPCEFSSWES